MNLTVDEKGEYKLTKDGNLESNDKLLGKSINLLLICTINNKTTMSNTLSVDKSTFLRLKNEYKNAINDSKDTFIFEGNELLTNYAKYLIEYFTPMFK